jgi:hypothetical protein
LFIAELNWAAGKGIIEDPDLMEVMLSYGESLIIDRLLPAGGITGTGAAEDPDISDATELYRIINSGRGGGDVPD